MYLFNEKTRSYETVNDDGTYIIKNGTVIGRMDLESAKLIEKMNVKMSWEPKFIYFCRFLMLTFGILSVFIILFTMFVIMSYFIILFSVKAANREEEAERLTRLERHRLSVECAK